jgi:hypothetical protein
MTHLCCCDSSSAACFLFFSAALLNVSLPFSGSSWPAGWNPSSLTLSRTFFPPTPASASHPCPWPPESLVALSTGLSCLCLAWAFVPVLLPGTFLSHVLTHPSLFWTAPITSESLHLPPLPTPCVMIICSLSASTSRIFSSGIRYDVIYFKIPNSSAAAT